MTDYTYSRVAALNFTTTPVTVGRSATGSVYAVGDITYTTPLTVTMVVGGATGTSISSDANGFFPDFTVANRTSVVFKQAGTSFTSVLTTTDPVPGPQGTPGTPGATGAQGPRGDLATWQASTFYPLNQAIINPAGDIVKVITAHTSGVSYDATKFDYANNTVVDEQTAAKINDTGSDTRAALNETILTEVAAPISAAVAPKLDITTAAATYAPAASTPRWKASTAYTTGDVVVSPGGALIKANSSFTSGTSYSGTNWTVIAAFAQMPRYYDDGGNYADRGSIQTIARNLADPPALAGSPALIFSEFNIVSGKGDNTTFRGVGAAHFQARDRTDVDATNKGVLYAIQASVAPQADRNNVPFDDVVGISIVNQGTAIGTDALYFGNNRADRVTNPGAKDFSNVIQNDMNSDSFVRSIATHDVGISFGGATFTTTAMRLGNTQSVAWNKANGTLKHVLRMTVNNTFQLAEGAGGIDIRDAFGGIYANAKVVMPNNTAIFGVRSASGENEMVRITTSDNLALFAARATVLTGGGMVLQDVTVVPSAPVGGHVIYSEAGVLKSKGPSGAITTIGAA